MSYGQVNADVIGTSVANSSLGAGNATLMKNKIINGACVIDQRNAGASVSISSGTNGYSADRWFYEYSGSATGVTVQQVSDAPAGFTNSVKLTVGTGASVSSGNYLDIEQKIEGYNFYDMGFGTANAKTITVSFWVKSSIAGTYGVCLQNAASGATRCYATSYVINSANTWEQKTITVAGDTTGTWVGVSNACAINLILSAGVGSGYQTSTVNAWQSSGFLFPNSITNTIISTSGATIQWTGVQLEVGSSATGYEYRNIQQELALCQRYYETSYDLGTAVGNNSANSIARTALGNYGGNNYGTFVYKVTKRAQPTVTFYDNNGSAGYLNGYYSSTTASVAASTNATGYFAINISLNGVTSYTFAQGNFAANAEL